MHFVGLTQQGGGQVSSVAHFSLMYLMVDCTTEKCRGT
jgi:hypothetical protein